MKKQTPAFLLVIYDILLIGAALCVFALFHHVLPRAYAVEQPVEGVISESAAVVGAASMVSFEGDEGGASGASAAETAAAAEKLATAAAAAAAPASAESATLGDRDLGDRGDLEDRFADKFTDGEVVSTDTVYISEDVNVTLTEVQENGVTYYVQDIYLRSIEYLRTAFARGTYGRSITAWVLDMAQDNDAIAAINGDYYGVNGRGVVIRNGVLYSDNVEGDVCVLFYDGTMEVIGAADFDAPEVMARGAYQAWSFGPSLLSGDGEALANFNSRISGVNPRTAIGTYEPGHYVFVVVDGRQAGYSDGMTLVELSGLFEKLGCQLAYNLDGGKTSAMTFGDTLANQPAQGGRANSDIIFVSE
jgi:exopolysaccharide biosynthesis protein